MSKMWMSDPSVQPKALILTKYGPLGASSRIRLLQLVPFFEQYLEIKVQHLFSDRYVKALSSAGTISQRLLAFRGVLRRLAFLAIQVLVLRTYEYVIVEQELVPNLPTKVEKILLRRLTKKSLIVDIDDGNHLRYEQLSGMKKLFCGHKFQKIWTMADSVVCGSRQLVDDVLASGVSKSDIALIPSVPPSETAGLTRNRHCGQALIVGWIGSPSTAEDLALVWRPLIEVSHEFPLEIHVLGAKIGPIGGLAIKCTPWSQEAEHELLASMDIGIMPLSDTAFKRRKCGFKLVQYMSVGIPVIASDVGGNRWIVIDGVESAGFIAETDLDWTEALRRLLEERELRERLGGQARSMSRRRFSVSVVQEEWSRILQLPGNQGGSSDNTE